MANYQADWMLISGGVDNQLHQAFAFHLTEFNRLPSTEPITVNFSTYGGDVYYALAIYDLIKASRRPVDIVANGPLMSAGTLIIQAARRRLATSGAYLLVHFGSESSDSQAQLKHWRELEKKWLSLFSERTEIGIRTVKKWHAGETYFSAEEALKVGLIDEVVA